MIDIPLPKGLRRRRPRPREAASVLAQIELVRALRRADLHHVLKGGACAVAVIAAADEADLFAEACKDFRWRFAGRNRDISCEVLNWAGGKPAGSRASPDALRRSLAANGRVFAIATRIEDVHRDFARAADGVIHIPPVDADAVRAAFLAVIGSAPPQDELTEVVGTSRSVLGIAIKRGRSASFAMRVLRRLLAKRDERRASRFDPAQPSLADLHGLGEAAAWGKALAADLDDYRAGRISWSDVDRGALLHGAPGVGKTTYAKALARTCDVTLHVHSLAQWQARGYLNDVLKAMRSAFEEARRDAPCILFVDELDAFGDRNVGGQHAEYWRQVINCFLESLDGASGREGVVVVGATNLPDLIDPAILRPGRLDRTVEIPLPDAEARAGILRFHLGEALPGVDLAAVAMRLEGASGAVIEQIVRDARRRARTARRPLAIDHLVGSLPSRPLISEASYRRACIHEAGHAVVGFLLRHDTGSAPTEVVVFREVAANGSGGRTTFSLDHGHDRTRQSYLSRIATFLGGLAAEQLVLDAIGDGGGGAENSDLHRATLLAGAMEVSLGLGDSLAYLSSQASEDILAWIRLDPALRKRVGSVLDECMEWAIELVTERREALDAAASELEVNGRLSGEALARLIAAPAPRSIELSQ